MKAGIQNRVRLPSAALATFDEIPRFEGNPHLFPGGRRGQGLSNMAMLKLLREMRPGMTVHGMRSSFRDWAAETTNFPRELAEMCLAHQVGNAVERAYQRGDLFEKRRRLMEAWTGFCSHQSGARRGRATARVSLSEGLFRGSFPCGNLIIN